MKTLAHLLLLYLPVAWAPASREPLSIACLVALVGLSTVEAALGPPIVTDRAGRWLGLMSGVGLLSLGWTAIATPGHSWAWLGLPCLLVGIVLRGLAMRALGARFSAAIVPWPGITTRGIYRYLRHPSEIGLGFLNLGLAIKAAAPLLLVLALLPIVLRIAAEERAISSGKSKHLGHTRTLLSHRR